MKNTSDSTVVETQNERIPAIDRFRGIAIFVVALSMMLTLFTGLAEMFLGADMANQTPFFAFLAKLIGHGDEGFLIVPNYMSTWTTDRGGIAFADLFAPMFIFIVGLTLVKSFKSREAKHGTKQAFLQLAVRFLGLIGIGAILNGYEDWFSVLGGDDFGTMVINKKVFMIGMFIVVAAFLAKLIIGFFKNEKLSKIASKTIRYMFAIFGIINLFFLLVRTSELIGSVSVTAFGGADWNVLQNIGIAGLFALPFVKFDKWGKLVVVASIMTAMTLFLHFGGSKVVSIVASVLEGGLFGALGGMTLVLLGSVFEDCKNNKKLYFSLAVILLATGLILAFGFKTFITKRGITPNFVMITAALSAFVYALISLFDNFKPKFAFFTWWGSNSILTYTISYMFCLFLAGVFILLEYVVPVWLAIIMVLIMVALLTLMNRALLRKRKLIKM